ncbi:MAG: recombinase family protein [Clostridia bacterium]|nr:recombinase family protein [Clostridia bacterium]
MTEKFDIAGYCRISVDEELDQENTSIENQKSIIEKYVEDKFPGSTLTLYSDRDRSGYTFAQREEYQVMRKKLMSHKHDILIIKDFSRFARRGGHGLAELEDLLDAGVRIISIGDRIDLPNEDDWLRVQVQFVFNELPVTDTSKKVRSVVKRRQEEGKWICAAPYGYIINKSKKFEIVPTEAEIVRLVFDLYTNKGWGYKKIANYLSDQKIPTPRESERDRKEAEGLEYKRKLNSTWSIVTVQGILDNDFYIGTLRQGKYTRKKINGDAIKKDEMDHIVIENNHQAIIDYRTFALTRAARQKRTTSNYRGVKKNDNPYTGFISCGDCGSPMFAVSRSDLKPGYICGAYHKVGKSACSRHYIANEKLDEMLKSYIRLVMENSKDMLARLDEDIKNEQEDIAVTEDSAEKLEVIVEELQEELKATKRQHIRDVLKHPDQEEILEETYDAIESDIQRKIEGLRNQIELIADKRNMIVRVNRVAKTAIDIFNDILAKDKLDKNDLELIIEKIVVYEKRIEIYLQADIDSILKSGTLEDAANFNSGIEDILKSRIVQSATNQKDKVFDVSVISDGEPLEIFTDAGGGVIFKKYSPAGEQSATASNLCDSMFKTCSRPMVVCDRDSIIASSGNMRRELEGKPLSADVERIMESRQLKKSEEGLPLSPSVPSAQAAVVAPVISEGDLCGCVAFLKNDQPISEVDVRMAQASALFFARQMEN